MQTSLMVIVSETCCCDAQGWWTRRRWYVTHWILDNDRKSYPLLYPNEGHVSPYLTEKANDRNKTHKRNVREISMRLQERNLIRT